MNDGARTILETADIGSIGCDLVEQSATALKP